MSHTNACDANWWTNCSCVFFDFGIHVYCFIATAKIPLLVVCVSRSPPPTRKTYFISVYASLAFVRFPFWTFDKFWQIYLDCGRKFLPSKLPTWCGCIVFHLLRDRAENRCWEMQRKSAPHTQTSPPLPPKMTNEQRNDANWIIVTYISNGCARHNTRPKLWIAQKSTQFVPCEWMLEPSEFYKSSWNAIVFRAKDLVRAVLALLFDLSMINGKCEIKCFEKAAAPRFGSQQTSLVFQRFGWLLKCIAGSCEFDEAFHGSRMEDRKKRAAHQHFSNNQSKLINRFGCALNMQFSLRAIWRVVFFLPIYIPKYLLNRNRIVGILHCFQQFH